MSIQKLLSENYFNRQILLYDIKNLSLSKNNLPPQEIRSICVSYEAQLEKFKDFLEATTKGLKETPNFKHAVSVSEFYTYHLLSQLRKLVLQADPLSFVTPVINVEETRSATEFSLELSRLAKEVCQS